MKLHLLYNISKVVIIIKISNIENELEETKKSAKLGQLIPLPGDTLAGSSHQLGAASKAVATAMAQLLTAATQVADILFFLIF